MDLDSWQDADLRPVIEPASGDDVRRLATAEVGRPETVHPRTGQIEPGGLFCERIFGHERDWECACGRLRGPEQIGFICIECDTPVVHLRSTRLGCIEVATPVASGLFLRSLALLLDFSPAELSEVVRYIRFVVVEPGDTPFRLRQLLDEQELRRGRDEYGNRFSVELGGEAFRQLLQRQNLSHLAAHLRQRLGDGPDWRGRQHLLRRLRAIDTFLRLAPRDPDGLAARLVLDCVPVIPPVQRPVPELGGSHDSGIINRLYSTLVGLSQRLHKLEELNAPEVIIRNDRRILQIVTLGLCWHRPFSVRYLEELCPGLVNFADRLRRLTGPNLLGKTVDYSARAVPVPDPALRPDQCGLPLSMVVELFRPHLLARLARDGPAEHRERARQVFDLLRPRPRGGLDSAWQAGLALSRELLDAIGETLPDHIVSVLHGQRLLVSRTAADLVSLEPVLAAGPAVRLHPRVAGPLRLSFAGESVQLHLLLSDQARAEAEVLLSAPVSAAVSPQAVLACALLSALDAGAPLRSLVDIDEARRALSSGRVEPSAAVLFRLPERWEQVSEEGTTHTPLCPRIHTSIGRILLNDVLGVPGTFINELVGAARLQDLLALVRREAGTAALGRLLDRLEALAGQVVCRSGFSLAVTDLPAVEGRAEYLERAWERIEQLRLRHLSRGLTGDQVYSDKLDVWDEVHDVIYERLDPATPPGPVSLLRRAGLMDGDNLDWLAGMHGLRVRPHRDHLSDVPTTANFREGLRPLEYFRLAQETREQRWDELVREQEVNDLARRLVAAAQPVVVTEEDCGSSKGMPVHNPSEPGEIAPPPLAARLPGRVTARPVLHPVTAEVVALAGKVVDEELAERLQQLGALVVVRSPLTCRAAQGVCQRCFGLEPATGRLVELGTPVGVQAALALSRAALRLRRGAEIVRRPPGRRPGPRSVAVNPDATLARLIELLEAHEPEAPVPLARCSGTFQPGKLRDGWREVFIQPAGAPRLHLVPADRPLAFAPGQAVRRGEPLAYGPLSPAEVVRVRGLAARQGLLDDLRRVFFGQQQPLDERYLEVVLSRLLRRVTVGHPGDSDLVPGRVLTRRAFVRSNERMRGQMFVESAGVSRLVVGSLVSREEFDRECARLAEAGLEAPRGRPARLARARPRLDGLTMAARRGGLASALSVGEPLSVLRHAALNAEADEELDLHGAALRGVPIPAGTGFRRP